MQKPISCISMLIFNVIRNYLLVSEAFLKLTTKGTVAKETNAETTKTKPENPIELPKLKVPAAKIGVRVCASPAIAHATPNDPP